MDITPDEGILVLKLPEQPHIIKMKKLKQWEKMAKKEKMKVEAAVKMHVFHPVS